MKRISIGFYDEVFVQLEEIMKEDGLSTIAQCVRELVDLAIKIRLAAKKNHDQAQGNDVLMAIVEMRNLLKNMLSWGLETRLLSRHIVLNQNTQSSDQQREYLEKYRNSAESYVQGLYGEKVE